MTASGISSRATCRRCCGLCSYDTICHEHVEYYSLGVVADILDRADFVIIDVQMNAVNGGSFAVTAAKRGRGLPANRVVTEWILEQEDRLGLRTPQALS